MDIITTVSATILKMPRATSFLDARSESLPKFDAVRFSFTPLKTPEVEISLIRRSTIPRSPPSAICSRCSTEVMPSILRESPRIVPPPTPVPPR